MRLNRWLPSLVALACLTVASVTFAQTPAPAQCPGAPISRLNTDLMGVVTAGGTANNVRSEPSINAAKIGALDPGTLFSIIEGPTCADGYTWWRVSIGNDYGWTAEGHGSDYFLEPYSPTPFATEQGGTLTVDNSGVQFRVDSAIAPAVSVNDLPAIQLLPDAPPWGIAPAGVRFVLFDGTQGYQFQHSTVTVYPAAGFAALDADTGQQIEALRALIANQTAGSNEEIPEIPGFNAAQAIRAAVKYLTLADGGKGVRFLTYYLQNYYPLTNDLLRYEFRGFSADGSHYVHAEFAVRASILPDLIDPATVDYSAEGSFQTYTDDITRRLTALPSDQFTPNLEMLDALFQSMTFNAGS